MNSTITKILTFTSKVAVLACLAPAHCAFSAEGKANAAPSVEIRAAVKAFITEQRGSFPVPFKYASADLNGDGVVDAVISLAGSDWCGTGGCTLLVLKGHTSGKFTLESFTTVADTPVRIASSKQPGEWSPLLVYTGQRGDLYLTHSAKGYPRNATSARKASRAEANASSAIITEESPLYRLTENGELEDAAE